MSEYIPGVCNIGPAEVARRRSTGITGSAATIALLGVLLAVRAPRPVRLVLALPAAGGATGFIQARTRFCAGFGMRGVFNFQGTGTTESVEQREFREEDRRTAIRILVASLAAGAGFAALTTALPR